MPKLGKREQGIAAFQVMELVAEAQRLQTLGHDVIHLEVGEPDFPTPQEVVVAGKSALDAGHTFYTPATGLPALQRALAAFYARRYGVVVAPERFIVTPGASGALQVVLGLTLDAGEQILLPEPGYPCNRQISALLNIEARCAPLSAAKGFALDPAWLASHWQAETRALMVASPANPTGKVLSRAELVGLQAWCAEKDAHLVVDEIYHGLNHTDERSHSILEVDAEAWV
ncbi:MAG: aminotransferase class I/II-fold pyridoxal phosphate-dependent enzyme, partial [Natronospirillum sp.]